MSVQFGRWNFDGQASAPDYIEKVSTTLSPYGPDRDGSYANGGGTMLYRAFHTTKELHHETQPQDPLVRFGGKKFEICEKYVASWLTNRFPAAHVTPYVGVQAVPPSCFVLLRLGRHGTMHGVTRYWDFDQHTSIRYRTDAEYQEHF